MDILGAGRLAGWLGVIRSLPPLGDPILSAPRELRPEVPPPEKLSWILENQWKSVNINRNFANPFNLWKPTRNQ